MWFFFFLIQVWDPNTLECVATLSGHSDGVMSLLYWENYLLSCSLDGTIKVWATTQQGKIEVIYTHKEAQEGHVRCFSIFLPLYISEQFFSS